jgi:hypothetical protein
LESIVIAILCGEVMRQFPENGEKQFGKLKVLGIFHLPGFKFSNEHRGNVSGQIFITVTKL